MELNIINTTYKLKISEQFIQEIERVAAESTSDNRGTSDVVVQLGEFIRNTCRFLQYLGNLSHSSPYISYGNDLYGYNTIADDNNYGIGIISFKIGKNTNGTITCIFVENINVDYTAYRLLLECRELSKMLSLMERVNRL